jgi:hypothetical protein
VSPAHNSGFRLDRYIDHSPSTKSSHSCSHRQQGNESLSPLTSFSSSYKVLVELVLKLAAESRLCEWQAQIVHLHLPSDSERALQPPLRGVLFYHGDHGNVRPVDRISLIFVAYQMAGALRNEVQGGWVCRSPVC